MPPTTGVTAWVLVIDRSAELSWSTSVAMIGANALPIESLYAVLTELVKVVGGATAVTVALAIPVLVAAAFVEVYFTPGLLRSLAG